MPPPPPIAPPLLRRRVDLRPVSGRAQSASGDGRISLAQLDDALKSVGVILSGADTERLFDRVDIHNEGKIRYEDFMRFTCGTLAVDLGETAMQRQRRVRKLRAWHTIAGDSSDGNLADPHDHYGKDAVGTADSHQHEYFPEGEQPISVANPAHKLTPKERNELVTQQRIVDLYAKNSKQIYDVLQVHNDKPINLAEFTRCSRIAGIRIAPADAERLFRSIDVQQRGTIDAGRLIAALDAHATSNLAQPSVFAEAGTDGSNVAADGHALTSGVPENTFYNGGLTRHASPQQRAAADDAMQRHNSGAAGMIHPAMERYTVVATDVGRADLSSSNLVSDPPSKATQKWFNGDEKVRQERLAAEKLMRRIQEAANPASGTSAQSGGVATRRGLTGFKSARDVLEKAFRAVPGVLEGDGGEGEGYVMIDDFTKGISNLGVQISAADARRLFAHFGADQNDALNFHSFAARVHDRNRQSENDGADGLYFRSEMNSDPHVLLDANGVPSRSKLYAADGSSNGGDYSSSAGGLRSGKVASARTHMDDMRRRLRVLAPHDPESCRRYLLHVFQKFDPEGSKGKVSRRDFRSAISNIERGMADDRKLGPVMQYLDQGYSGDIDYRSFVESVMEVTNDDRPIGVVEQYARRQEAVRRRMAHKHKEKGRIDWNMHRWQNFQNKWVEKHGAAAAREMRMDADIAPSGDTWSSAPENKQPFRIFHPIVASPRGNKGQPQHQQRGRR